MKILSLHYIYKYKINIVNIYIIINLYNIIHICLIYNIIFILIVQCKLLISIVKKKKRLLPLFSTIKKIIQYYYLNSQLPPSNISS